MFGKIKVTNFGKRHFDSKFGGTKITNVPVEFFEEYLNGQMKIYDEHPGMLEGKVMDGYAPFCKLVAIKNFTNAKIGTMPISLANYQYLRSGYSSRTEKELPVFTRWFELPIAPPVADYLVVVLYSREQLQTEHEKQGNTEPFELSLEEAWGVVAILGQTHPNEEPMQPITMMRNALGKEEGGSGVPLDREKYLQSVKFWSEHAIVKS